MQVYSCIECSVYVITRVFVDLEAILRSEKDVQPVGKLQLLDS